MVFPFFELPREIRDAIYERTITDHREASTPQTDDDTTTYTFDTPLPALLRCSRRLNTEYHELLPEKRRLLVLGANSDNWLGYPDIDEHIVRTIEECTVLIHNGCLCDNMDPEERAERERSTWQCDGQDFMETYNEALAKFLAQFPRLQHVYLRVALYGSDDAKHDTRDVYGDPPQLGHTFGFAQMLGCLVTTSANVTDLHLVRCRSVDDYSAYCNDQLHGPDDKIAERSADIYATWKSHGGWQAGPAMKGQKI